MARSIHGRPGFDRRRFPGGICESPVAVVVAVQKIGQFRFATGRQMVEGRELIFAASPVGRRVDTRTFLLLATVVRPIIGGLEDLARPLLIAGAAALAMGILFALLMARSIVQPLGELTRASEALAPRE